MSQSEDLFSRAQKVIPGGVNSPVRAFKGVGGTPLFIKRAESLYSTIHHANIQGSHANTQTSIINDCLLTIGT